MARVLQLPSPLLAPSLPKTSLHKAAKRATMATSALSSPMPLRGESGTKIPRLVYGTAWKKDKTADLVYQALKAGFRGVDTAAQPRHYQEALVGDGIRRAIKDGIVDRKDLFVRLPELEFPPYAVPKFSHLYWSNMVAQTKIPDQLTHPQIQTKYTPRSGQDLQNMPYDPQLSIADQVHASVASSLANLSTSTDASPASAYLDSVLLHSPLPKLEGTAIAWNALSSYVASGKIRHLGIANVSLPVLAFLVTNTNVKPSVVQNRFYPDSRYEVQLRRFCREQGIVFQSFWTLTGNPGLLKSGAVKELARQVGVSVQVALYALVVGLEKVTVLDGTTNEGRMVEDLEGLAKVGRWVDAKGKEEWESILEDFKELIVEM